MSTRKPIDLLILPLIVLLLLWQPRYLHQELNLFEWGLYLPGIEAVTQGQVPYRDFFHLRGPFELYLPAAVMKVFGFRADVLASYFYFGSLLTIILTTLIAYELLAQRVLLYSFVLLLITRTFPRVVFTYWGGMRYAWGLLAVWCLVRFLKCQRPVWLGLAGCVAAISCWTSIEVGVSVLAAFIAAMVFSREIRRGVWIFGAGFFLISLPYALYLLAQGAWGAYCQDVWVVLTRMGKVFVQTSFVPATVPQFLHTLFVPDAPGFYKFTPLYCYMAFAFYYLGRIFKGKAAVLDHAAMVLATYGLVLFVSAWHNLWASEYEMALQPEKLVLFFLWGQAIIWAEQKFDRSRWVGTVLAAAVVISSTVYFIAYYHNRYYKISWGHQLMHHRKSPELINGTPTAVMDLPRIKHMTIPVWQAADLRQLKRFVDEHVPAHEAVWMYPELGSLHFILQRPWVGRFPQATLSWMDDGWFAEYENALEKNAPRYAIVNKVMPRTFDEVYFLVPANRIKHERMMQFLYNHYKLISQTPSYFIYANFNN